MAYQSAKIVFLGDDNVGKTSLLTQLACGIEAKIPWNIPLDNVGMVQLLTKLDNKTIHIQMVDTEGGAEHDRLRPLSYPQTDCMVIMFDLTNRKSFENVAKWQREAYHHCPNAPIFLLGTKSDLRDKLLRRYLPRQRETVKSSKFTEKFKSISLSLSSTANISTNERNNERNKNTTNQYAYDSHILKIILAYLPTPVLAMCSSVCKKWQVEINEEMWREKARTLFSMPGSLQAPSWKEICILQYILQWKQLTESSFKEIVNCLGSATPMWVDAQEAELCAKKFFCCAYQEISTKEKYNLDSLLGKMINSFVICCRDTRPRKKWYQIF